MYTDNTNESVFVMVDIDNMRDTCVLGYKSLLERITHSNILQGQGIDLLSTHRSGEEFDYRAEYQLNGNIIKTRKKCS